MKFTKELIEQATKCKTVEDLLALAKANNIEMSQEEAQKYFAQLSGEALDLDALDSVAGGCFTALCAGDVSAVC